MGRAAMAAVGGLARSVILETVAAPARRYYYAGRIYS